FLLGTTARADLHFQEPLFDAGEIRAGMPLAHKFPFTNKGPNPVEVTDARASCGCLTPRMEKRLYQPGEAGFLLLEINTLNQPAGFGHWTVQVVYRDGQAEQESKLEMTGKVIAEIIVQPAAMTVFADNAVTHDITVTDTRPKPLAITDVRTSSAQLLARLAGESRDAAGHPVRKIVVEVAGDYPEGRHDETLVIYTDDPLYRELKVPVNILKHLRQRLTALPDQVTLKAPPGQPVPARIVLVRDRDQQPVEVASVDTDDPAVACQWARGPGAMATVKIKVDRSKIQGTTLQTAIHVHVSKPAAQEVVIPVVCTLP
ncbi:MAG: DUF1573 domain-containing protein, partial [Planctomycetes bacterium]|nr:DUF1573 domain-containing protein [Planctomycetota bacterium]